MLTARIPAELEEAIGERARFGSSRGHVCATAELTERYRRRHTAGPLAQTREEVIAYAVARLPATYAATSIVLDELRRRVPSFAPVTQLDLGAGPGTALWAAVELWPSLRRLTGIDAEREMLQLAKELAHESGPVLETAEWVEGRLPVAVPAHMFDLVTMAYVLGELEERPRRQTLDRTWAASAQALAVVEPGTPAGYGRVIAARDRLVAAGGTVVAPCPHDRACPLLGSGDWCHFGVRLARTSAHRLAKGAQLGHEDEKFSYVVVARTPPSRAVARILRHPKIRGGHVLLDLCTAGGVRRDTVSRRDHDRFRRARKSAWGGDFEP
jgi:ribosomal protein RSM22 (predicted rRNA methylase)